MNIIITHLKYFIFSDEALEQEIQCALEYLKLRPFEHKIYRMLPMGISLSLTILSLCITYVIVLSQLTLM